MPPRNNSFLEKACSCLGYLKVIPSDLACSGLQILFSHYFPGCLDLLSISILGSFCVPLVHFHFKQYIHKEFFFHWNAFFWRARVGWPLLLRFRPFGIFVREVWIRTQKSAVTNQARYQLSLATSPWHLVFLHREAQNSKGHG